MNLLTIAGELHDRCGIVDVFADRFFLVIVIVRGSPVVTLDERWDLLQSLGIVYRRGWGEYQYVLVLFQRGLLRIQKSRTSVLLPYQRVFQPVEIGATEDRGERHLRCQDYRAVWLDYPLVFVPQRFQGYLSIPLVPRASIRQVSEDHINLPPPYFGHYVETVTAIGSHRHRWTPMMLSRVL